MFLFPEAHGHCFLNFAPGWSDRSGGTCKRYGESALDWRPQRAREYELAGTPIKKRKYLTYEELEKSYGASKEDLDAVENFAQKHNLMVVHRSAADRSVVLKGRLGDLLSAFHADLAVYHHATGTYRGQQGGNIASEGIERYCHWGVWV